MQKYSIFNIKFSGVLLLSLSFSYGFHSFGSETIKDLTMQHAGTIALTATAAYAGCWFSDFGEKVDQSSPVAKYMRVQNPYYRSVSEELPRHILLYGTSENKIKEAQSFANVPVPNIVLSARELQNTDVPALFKAVTLFSDYYSWAGIKDPRIPIIITDIENFRMRTSENHELSNLLQAIENNPHVPVIGITNAAGFFGLDEALIRPGRLDHHICLNSGEIQLNDIQHYMQQDVIIESEYITNILSVSSKISPQGIEKALKEMGLSLTMNTLNRVFDIAGKISMRRKKPKKIGEERARGNIIPQDILKALICAENREKLDIKGIPFVNILMELFKLTNWYMNMVGRYNSRCFLSLITKEKLLILVTQLQKKEDVQEKQKFLQGYIVEHIDESLSRLITICSCLYNIKDSHVFDEKKAEWKEYIKTNWKDDYFNNNPTDYFYETIIPELIVLCEKNKGTVLMLTQVEQKQNEKSSFLSKLNLNSTYSRLSFLLSCSALVLWYKWFFADKGIS